MNILISALSYFEEDWLVSTDFETSRNALVRQIKEGKIDIESLRREYLNAVNSIDTNWTYIASKAGLFSDISMYSDSEIRDIVQLYLWEILFPEKITADEQLKRIELKIKSILEDAHGEWVNVDQLVSDVKKVYPEMKSYMIYFFNKYFSLSIDSQGELAKLWIVDRIKLK